jgi:predicted phage terminase large subunit-like protein
MAKTDLTKMLADTIRNKAAQTTVSTQTPLQWGKQYVPHFFFRQGCQFHEDISNVLHDMTYTRGQKVLVLAPRGNAKSTICSMLAPLKAICEGTEKYILLLADTSEQAEAYLKTIAEELDYNETLREKYPIACKHGDVWNAGRIETGNGVCIEALGKGKSVRGRKFRQYRPTLIILDDPQNDDDIISPSMRAKDMNWLDKALIPCGDKDTNYFIIGTNLHRECIVNVLTTRADFRVMRYASIMQWPKNMELWENWEQLYMSSGEDKEKPKDYYIENKATLDEDAQVLWPEKESLYELMVLRANIGHVAFACEKCNDPRDPSKCEFDELWFDDDVYYDTLPVNKKLITVGFADPAKGGETKKHDYSAIILLHYCPEDKCCYVTADMEKRPVNKLIEDINRNCKVYAPFIFGIEANGFQSLIGEEATALHPLLPLQAIENYGVHKHTRISRLSLWFHRRFFRFKRHCKYTKILMQQILDHPHSAHDDGPDAMEAALRILTSACSLTDDDTVVEAAQDDIGDNIFDNNMYMGRM